MDVDQAQSDSDDQVDELGDAAAAMPAKKMGRPPKKFEENGPTQRRAKLQKPLILNIGNDVMDRCRQKDRGGEGRLRSYSDT